MHGTWIGLTAHIVIETLVIIRVMLRPHREPASRIAWVAVIAALPVVGALAYLLFGEVNIGRKRIARRREVNNKLRELCETRTDKEGPLEARVPNRYEPIF